MGKDKKIIESQSVDIDKLNLADYNPRIMLEQDKDELRKSIETFGLVEPIVANSDFTVIGGHQRLVVAREMGFKTVPCVIVTLDKKQEKVLNLALNKISGYWDEEKLADIISDLKEDAIGFQEEEVSQYITRRELVFENDGTYDADDDEELKKLFERHEKVGVKVEEPGAVKRKDQLAFYCSTFEEYDAIRKNFATSRKGELDVAKIVSSIVPQD